MAAARTAVAAISGRRHGAIAIRGSGGGVIDLVMRLFLLSARAARANTMSLSPKADSDADVLVRKIYAAA